MTAETSARILKALADPSRLRILRALLAAPCYVEQLAVTLALAAPTISHHLKKLEEAGLVRKTRDQYYTIYRVRPELLAQDLRSLVEDAGDEESAQALRLAAHRRKILRSFFRDGRVERLPAQRKKRLVVLAALAADFEVERVYPETELNEIITRRHDDFCTVRRDLVDFRMMTRATSPDGVVEYRLAKKPDVDRLPPPDSAPERRPSVDERKARVRLYKEGNRRAGVYAVRNRETGRVLLGSSRNLHGPLNRHRAELNFGSHRCRALQKDWNALGPEAFAFEILERVDAALIGLERDAALKDLEQKWISASQPFAEKCYNGSVQIRTKPF